jgi:hypothetical protein
MSNSRTISLVEQLTASNRFDWSNLQKVLQEFSIVAKPALCSIDFFHSDRILRVKTREVLDLPVALNNQDWEFCFALADGHRPIGSDVPHWLKELSEGVFSRSTCLAAEPIHDENGLTVGLLYAFFTNGTPEELVTAYMRSLAKECSTVIQLWQYSERHQELLGRLWTSIELSCPGFLILDERLRIVQKGSLYSKSIPSLVPGDRFEQHFMWDAAFSVEEWKQQGGVKSKLRFYHSLEFNQRYKCTVQCIQPDMFLLLANPVVNSNHAMVDYHLTASDFPAHDYITDFVFLQTTTLQSLEEVQRSNEMMQFRNRELEILQAELLRSKLILENKISERNERVIRLSNFPEQNPNPVFEVDYTRQFICFSNRAAKDAFGDLLTLPYADFLSMLSLSHELVSGSYKLRAEFESGNRYFIADATRVPNEEIVRFYANDATELRQLKTLLFKQQQGLNQLLGVLEALNIDKDEALRSANLSDVIQEVTKLLGGKNT